jgi:hypothetical protein
MYDNSSNNCEGGYENSPIGLGTLSLAKVAHLSGLEGLGPYL